MYTEIITRAMQDPVGETAGLIGEVASVILYILGILFLFRMMVSILIGQLDLTVGNDRAVKELIVNSAYILLALLLAVNANKIAADIGEFIQENAGLLTSTSVDGIYKMAGKIGLMLLQLGGVLAVSVTMITIVFSAVRGSLSATTGNTEGLSSSIKQAIMAAALITVGFIVIVVGKSLL